MIDRSSLSTKDKTTFSAFSFLYKIPNTVDIDTHDIVQRVYSEVIQGVKQHCTVSKLSPAASPQHSSVRTVYPQGCLIKHRSLHTPSEPLYSQLLLNPTLILDYRQRPAETQYDRYLTVKTTSFEAY